MVTILLGVAIRVIGNIMYFCVRFAGDCLLFTISCDNLKRRLVSFNCLSVFVVLFSYIIS